MDGTLLKFADESLPLTGKPFHKDMGETPVTLAPLVGVSVKCLDDLQ